MAMMASSTRRPSAMISAPSEAGRVHDEQNDRQHQRHRERDDDAGAPAEREEAHDQDDDQRLGEGLDELGDGVVDDVRLVGDLGDIDADRQLAHDRVHRALEVVAEGDDVGAVLHRYAQPDRRLAFLAEEESRRILVAALHGGDVAEPEGLTVGHDRHRGDGGRAGEGAGNAQVDAVGGGVDRAAGEDGVLLGDAVEDLLRRDAEIGELGVAELDEDLLRPLADDVDLVDVRDTQQPLTDVLGAGLEIGEAHAVGGEHVECGIDVAVLVVEVGAGDAGRELALDVTDLLADLVPELLHLGGRGLVAERDADERAAGLRVALDAVEVG
jgi:hypothetical protein